MKLRMAVAISVLALAASVRPVSAHHSVPETFDISKEITIRGAVTKIEWTNPHGRFWVDGRNDDGTVSNWELELPASERPEAAPRFGFHQTRRSGHRGSVAGEGWLFAGQHDQPHCPGWPGLQLLSQHNGQLGNVYESKVGTVGSIHSRCWADPVIL